MDEEIPIYFLVVRDGNLCTMISKNARNGEGRSNKEVNKNKKEKIKSEKQRQK